MEGSKADNCRKNCLRGWWEETRCVDKPLATMEKEYGGKKYNIPSLGTFIAKDDDVENSDTFVGKHELPEEEKKVTEKWLMPLLLIAASCLLLAVIIFSVRSFRNSRSLTKIRKFLRNALSYK